MPRPVATPVCRSPPPYYATNTRPRSGARGVGRRAPDETTAVHEQHVGVYGARNVQPNWAATATGWPAVEDVDEGRGLVAKCDEIAAQSCTVCRSRVPPQRSDDEPIQTSTYHLVAKCPGTRSKCND